MRVYPAFFLKFKFLSAAANCSAAGAIKAQCEGTLTAKGIAFFAEILRPTSKIPANNIGNTAKKA